MGNKKLALLSIVLLFSLVVIPIYLQDTTTMKASLLEEDTTLSKSENTQNDDYSNSEDIVYENEQSNMGSENKSTDGTEIEEISPKYYVNKNYFIKPVNPEDSNLIVLLTFDDAPQGNYTLEILDTLDKYNAKAIFFINGHYAVKNPDLVTEIHTRGHIIGNHTWWHEHLRKIDYEKTKKEIIDVNDLVEEILGERPQYFRPPYGAISDNAREIVAVEGMQSMNWSLGSLDWEYTKPEQSQLVIDQVVSNIIPGSNILMHDREVTALALDQILLELTNMGYQFVLPTEVIIK